MGALLATIQDWLLTPLTILAGSCLLFLAWASLSFFERRRQLFHLLLGTLLVIATVIVILASFTYKAGWVFAIATLIVAGWVIVHLFQIEFLNRRLLTKAGIVTLACALTFAGILTHQAYRQSSFKVDDRLRSAANSLVVEEETARAHTHEIARDEIIRKSAKDGVQPSLINQMQRLMLQNNLQSLTLVNQAGIVIARAHNPQKSGDSVLSYAPWIISTLKGDEVSGKIYDEQGNPAIMVASAVTVESVPFGALMATVAIDKHVAESIRSQFPGGLAIGTPSGVSSYSTGSDIEKDLYGSSALDDLVRQSLTPASRMPQTLEYHLTYNGLQYLVQGQVLSTLVEGQTVAMLALETEVPPIANPLLATLFAGLLALALVNFDVLQLPKLKRKEPRG